MVSGSTDAVAAFASALGLAVAFGAVLVLIGVVVGAACYAKCFATRSASLPRNRIHKGTQTEAARDVNSSTVTRRRCTWASSTPVVYQLSNRDAASVHLDERCYHIRGNAAVKSHDVCLDCWSQSQR